MSLITDTYPPLSNWKEASFKAALFPPIFFLLAIEILGISIRSNSQIEGIKIGNTEHKVSMLADDTTCFLNGNNTSFEALFALLDNFAQISGCKINLSKSESVWLGSLKGSTERPFSDKGTYLERFLLFLSGGLSSLLVCILFLI